MDRKQLLEDFFALNCRIREMREARDRQAAEWRAMLNKAEARRSYVAKQLSAGEIPGNPIPGGDE